MHIEPRSDHQDFFEALKEAMSMTAQMMPAPEVLAIASQFVGMLIGVQDKASMTPQQALEIVGRNMEIGNASYLRSIPD